MRIVASATYRFLIDIGMLISYAKREKWYENMSYYERLVKETLSVEECRELILGMERQAEQIDLERFPLVSNHPEITRRILQWKFPFFHDIEEEYFVEGLNFFLERHHSIVLPSEIPQLLLILNVPKCRDGMELEDHGYGYHFHFGKVSGHRIERTNLLLTFDDSGEEPAQVDSARNVTSNRPLYGETHAEGKNLVIHMDQIGMSKRPAIYGVCFKAAQHKGFNCFKRPGRKARVFYPEESRP